MPPRSGYTLIELMAVVAVVGLAVGAVVLHLDGATENARLRAAARRIGALVAAAGNRSAVDGRSMWLEYDCAAGTVRTIAFRPAPTSDSAGDRAADPAPLSVFRMPEGVALAEVALEGGGRPPQRPEVVRLRILPGGFVAPHRVRLAAGNHRSGEVTVDGSGRWSFRDDASPEASEGKTP